MFVNMIFDSTMKSFNMLKAALLLFDEINVQYPETDQIVYNLPRDYDLISNYVRKGQINCTWCQFKFINTEMLNELKKLNDSKVITMNNYPEKGGMPRIIYDLLGKSPVEPWLRNGKNDKKNVSLSEHNQMKKSSDIYRSITQNATSFFSDLKYGANGWEYSNLTQIVDEDAKEIFENLYREDIVQFLYERHDVNVLRNSIIKQHVWFSEFYYFLFCTMYRCILRNENILTTNDFVLKVLNDIKFSNQKEMKKGRIIANTVELLFPDFSFLDIVDIYEIRLKAHDELLELNDYINKISDEYDSKDYSASKIDSYIHNKVQPMVKDLERKIYGLKINMLQKAIRDARNPISYLPLLTSLFNNVDNYLALAVSAGMIGMDMLLEYRKLYYDVKSHPLFFTININKMIPKSFV